MLVCVLSFFKQERARSKSEKTNKNKKKTGRNKGLDRMNTQAPKLTVFLSPNLVGAGFFTGGSLATSQPQAQVAPGSYEGHYANSSLRPVLNYVSRPRLHQKIKEQLYNLKDDGVEDVQILVV